MLVKRFCLDLINNQYVLGNFVSQELTVKYKRSALGFLWSLLNPLATMLISSFVFGSIMRFDLKDFVVFLYAGLLPWNFFGISIDFCGTSILNAEGFIKKVYIPKIIFPMSIIISKFIDMVLSMVALFVIMIFIGAKASFALLFLPISFIIIFLFTTGFSLLLATVTVFFRDSRYLMNVAMNAWYYLTPILYPIEVLPEKVQWLFYLNPSYYVIEMFRAPIYLHVLPNIENILIAVAVSVTIFLLGLRCFYKYEKEFVFRL